MVIKQMQRQHVIGLLSASFLETGLAKTSLRQLAAAAKVSDRMLLYYFKDKSEIITAILMQIASDMSDHLASAIPKAPALAPDQLIAKAIDATRADDMRPYMQLWIEIVAAAAQGERPYDTISQQIAVEFTTWIEARLDIGQPETKRGIAAMILVIIDGLALLDTCGGKEQSKLAIQALQNISIAP